MGRSQGAVLAGVMLGAVLAFLFDPRSGRRRRALIRDQTGAAIRAAVRRLRRTGRMVAADAGGYRARFFHGPPPPERRDPDDATLAQKVETILFRPAEVPKGQINVNVQNGVVQLRGEVPRAEMISDLVEKARKVAGVREVENLLHLPGTPAPMHE